MMAECRATLRLCAAAKLSPAAVIRQLNQSIQPDMRPGMFITIFYGILDLDTNALRYVRAGHEPVLLVRKGATAPELLGGDGLAVGLDEGAVFDSLLEEREVALAPGDLVALYTDGITEARNAKGEEFGRDRLAAALMRHEDRSLSDLAKTIDRWIWAMNVKASAAKTPSCATPRIAASCAIVCASRPTMSRRLSGASVLKRKRCK